MTTDTFQAPTGTVAVYRAEEGDQLAGGYSYPVIAFQCEQMSVWVPLVLNPHDGKVYRYDKLPIENAAERFSGVTTVTHLTEKQLEYLERKAQKINA